MFLIHLFLYAGFYCISCQGMEAKKPSLNSTGCSVVVDFDGRVVSGRNGVDFSWILGWVVVPQSVHEVSVSSRGVVEDPVFELELGSPLLLAHDPRRLIVWRKRLCRSGSQSPSRFSRVEKAHFGSTDCGIQLSPCPSRSHGNGGH